MSTRVWRRLSLATAVMCMALAAGAGAQNADDAFKRGLDLLDDRKWAEAADSLREAIKLRPQESPSRVRSGIGSVFGAGGTEYLPYFFLGRALQGAGDCAAAVNAWATSEQHGAIQRSRPEFMKQLQTGYVECEKLGVLPPAKFDPAMARLYQLLDNATRVQSRVNQAAQANLDVWRAEAGIREQYDRANADIEAGRSGYDTARRTRSQRDIDAAAQALERGRPLLEKVEAGLRAVIDSRLSAQALARDVASDIELADSLRAAVESKKLPFTPEMTSSFNDARDAIGNARGRLAEGQRTSNPQTLSAARTMALDAQERLRSLLAEITKVEEGLKLRAVNEAVERARNEFSLLDSAVATLERLASTRPGVLEGSQEDERKAAIDQAARVRRRLEAAIKGENPEAINEATRLAVETRDRVNPLIAIFGPPTLRDRGVHAMLEQGARQYFAGEFEQAAASLAAGETVDESVALRQHFHLLRAAALYEMFLRSQDRDPELEAQARQEVEHSKAIDSTFQPDARAFSPRFMSFYASIEPPATAGEIAGTAAAAQP